MHRNASAPMSAPGTTKAARTDERVVWSAREASARLGIPVPTVYAYVKSGDLPAVKLRGRLLIPCEAVQRLIDQAMDEWGGPDAV